MPRWLKYVIGFFMLLVLVAVTCVQPVDRTPYQELPHYKKMMGRLDSLFIHHKHQASSDTLLIGWSKVNITPREVAPLAGFGGRDPKHFANIRDSIYVRTVLFNDGQHQAAYVSADLLIIPPEVTLHLRRLLPEISWDLQQVFLTATHTHSSIGGWAPGLVGHLFSGKYRPELPEELAQQIVKSIRLAQEKMASGYLSYNELQAPELIKNRLVKNEGQVDPNFKIIGLKSGDLTGYLTSFSAHATCLGRHNHELSGDFPGSLVANLEEDSLIDFALFGAGAVGSMGPRTIDASDEFQKVRDFSNKLTEYVRLVNLLNPDYIADVKLDYYRIPLEMGAPMVKISKNLALRPWLFQLFFGEYPAEVSFLQIGNTVFLGLPGDFSGELALPIYESARENGLNLVINSFNGGYIGYIIKDQWYDLSKYESRTMSWYGPGNGAYISTVINKIIGQITIEE